MNKTNTVKYPEINVKLIGQDGNAFVILGKVLGAMRRAKVPKTDMDMFESEAMSGDYNKLLQTCMRWVSVE